MFTVVITEKGGAQRKLEFTEAEVTIGRVQGNDIVLPKGNVSKRHSRIVLKDGRFIVVDLKSTNGTYVNGRKITSPLVVKEGDKIYIGDFILTLEGDAEGDGSEVPLMRAPSKMAPPPDEGATPSAPAPPPPDASLAAPPAPRISSVPPEPGASVTGAEAPMKKSAPPPPKKSFPPAREAKTRIGLADPPDPLEPVRSSKPPPVMRTEAPASMPPVLGGGSTSSVPPEMRDDLNSLMQRLGSELDVEPTEASAELSDTGQARTKALQAVEAVISKLQREGVVSPSVDTRKLAEAALTEAAGLGPLASLLADPDARHIVIERHDVVRVDHGSGLEPQETRFSSPQALLQTARRLCARAGASADDGIAELSLPEGGHALVMWPPAVTADPVISIRRRPARPAMFEDLGADGVIDADQARAVTEALKAKRNVLIVGPSDSGVDVLLGAALATCPDDERVAVVERHPEVAIGDRAAVCLSWGRDPLRVLDHLEHFAPKRLVLHGLMADTGNRVMHLLASRRDGSLCSMQARSAQAAFDELQSHSNGVSVTEAVQLVAECERTDGGRARLIAVYETEDGGLKAL